MERTLILVKPDGVQRGLVGAIIGRLEQRGLKLVGLKLTMVSRALAEQHHAEHVGKGFYQELLTQELLTFITSSPIVAALVEGPNAKKPSVSSWAARTQCRRTLAHSAAILLSTLRPRLRLTRQRPTRDRPLFQA